MKSFVWLLILGVVIYFMYRRVQDFGFPWEDQIVVRGVETMNHHRSGGAQVHVRGEVRNMTRKRVQAEIECKSLPAGMTLSPKASMSVALQPEEVAPFDMMVKANANTTGAECKVSDWTAGNSFEERVIRSVRQLYIRVRALL